MLYVVCVLYVSNYGCYYLLCINNRFFFFSLHSDIEEFGRGTGENLAMLVQWMSAIVTLLVNSLVQSLDVTGVIFPYFPCIIFAAVGSFWVSSCF